MEMAILPEVSIKHHQNHAHANQERGQNQQHRPKIRSTREVPTYAGIDGECCKGVV